jgi:hypothetical protein
MVFGLLFKDLSIISSDEILKMGFRRRRNNVSVHLGENMYRM